MELSYAIARYEKAAELLPIRWQQAARRLPDWRKAQAEEFRLRTGRPMTVLTCEGEVLLSDELPRPLVTQSDLEQLCDMVTGYSRYAVSDTLSKGYLIGRGGFRIGVCGTAVQKDRVLRIANVHDFPGHIACDSASQSEIVLPIRHQGRVIGVLDIDSPTLARFDETDERYLSELVIQIQKACSFDRASYTL